jgi:hypothetical protein
VAGAGSPRRAKKIYERIVPMGLDHERSLLAPVSQTEQKENVRIIEKRQSQVDRLWTGVDPAE